jgi:hypothetical protein
VLNYTLIHQSNNNWILCEGGKLPSLLIKENLWI